MNAFPYLKIFLMIFILSCVRSPDQLNNLDPNNSDSFRFKNLVEKVSLEEVVKELPNYINLKSTFSLIMIGKLSGEDILKYRAVGDLFLHCKSYENCITLYADI